MFEHADVAKETQLTYQNIFRRQEHYGIDVFGNEIVIGDSIVEMPNGEIVLEDSLEDYLIEVLGFVFKTAE